MRSGPLDQNVSENGLHLHGSVQSEARCSNFISVSQVLLRYLVQKDLGFVVRATSEEQQRAALDVYRHEFKIPEKEVTLLEAIARKTGYED